MSDIPTCPECQSDYTYQNGPLFACPDCSYEWSTEEAAAAAEALIMRDAHGNALCDGDTVQLTKDLKVKGTSTTLKIGTKVKKVRLRHGEDHDLDCKIDGIGAMKLKSQFVKKI